MGKISNPRPKVTLTYAQSLDGSIAARRGESLAISSAESLRMTHQLRAQHDAILVGIGTVLADDPQLTVRLVEGPNPQPLILDSRLRFPLEARLMGNPRKPWIVTTGSTISASHRFATSNTVTTQNASEDRLKVLESLGVKVLVVQANPSGQIDLSAMLVTLYESGIRNLMVEGGGRVITSFLQERLVDDVVLTISPVFVGGVRAVETILDNHSDFPRLDSVRVETHGPDWVVRGTLKH